MTDQTTPRETVRNAFYEILVGSTSEDEDWLMLWWPYQWGNRIAVRMQPAGP